MFARVGPGGTETHLTDALDNTIGLTDSLGWPADTTYEYGPFGEVQEAGATANNPVQYTGRSNDGDGLYHYRARYYRPDQQRFISEDPLGLGGGSANQYSYAANDPINNTDPMGLSPFGDVFGPGGFVDSLTPDSWSNFSAGMFDGALVGLPSAAFGAACWGSDHKARQRVGAVAGGTSMGFLIASRLAGRGLWRLVMANAAGGAWAGAHTRAGQNPNASYDSLAAGGILGATGGAYGGALAGAAAGRGSLAGAAAVVGGSAVGVAIETGGGGGGVGGGGGDGGSGGGGAAVPEAAALEAAVLVEVPEALARRNASNDEKENQCTWPPIGVGPFRGGRARNRRDCNRRSAG